MERKDQYLLVDFLEQILKSYQLQKKFIKIFFLRLKKMSLAQATLIQKLTNLRRFLIE